MFYGFPEWLMSPAMRKRQQEYENREKQRRLEICENWDPMMKFRKELNIRGKSYNPRSLFKIKPSKNHPNEETDKACFKFSPSRNFCYYEMILPKGSQLTTAQGRSQGTVLFDSAVRIPALYERRDRFNHKEGWRKQPWMSNTPQEVFTIRPGNRFAKGTVVMGGLGMGYQLEEICKRKQVKKVIVVERSEELVDWIWPTLDLGGRDDDVEFIIGDAKEEIPELEADAALIDIYPSYGGNDFPPCPNIRKVWVWGSQYCA